jgi:hypothetical protein
MKNFFLFEKSAFVDKISGSAAVEVELNFKLLLPKSFILKIS